MRWQGQQEKAGTHSVLSGCWSPRSAHCSWPRSDRSAGGGRRRARSSPSSRRGSCLLRGWLLAASCPMPDVKRLSSVNRVLSSSPHVHTDTLCVWAGEESVTNPPADLERHQPSSPRPRQQAGRASKRARRATVVRRSVVRTHDFVVFN